MSIKFEAFRIDLEDENKVDFDRIISKVAKEAYNRGVSDSHDAIFAVDPSCDAQEEFQCAIENAVCANYVK